MAGQFRLIEPNVAYEQLIEPNVAYEHHKFYQSELFI